MSVNNNTDFDLDYQEDVDTQSVFENQSFYNVQVPAFDQSELYRLGSNSASFSNQMGTAHFGNDSNRAYQQPGGYDSGDVWAASNQGYDNMMERKNVEKQFSDQF